MKVDREQIFQWRRNRDFGAIVTFLKDEKQSTILEDPVTRNAIDGFFIEIIADSEIEGKYYLFEQLSILHSKNFYELSDICFTSIIEHLVQNAPDVNYGYGYAKLLPDNEICAALIAKYEKEQLKTVEHSQENLIQVKKYDAAEQNFSKSIFNSKQEQLFFMALRNCFPMFFIYPNVNLSTILNRQIKQHLTDSEMKFWFSTTVDFVIIDQFEEFKPIGIIETDSEWHRQPEQVPKDKIKNKILQISGIAFYRIEHFKKHKTVEEFEEVIRETIKL